MILTCPNCESRYLLPATRLAPGGRRVKCSSCGEVWSQTPDASELQDKNSGDRDIDFREIPESVKPIRESIVLPKPPKEKKRLLSGALAGYASAACVFLAVFAGIAMAKERIVESWPPATLFYETIGQPVPPPSEGLDFAEITAKAVPGEGNAGEFIEITGRIVNTADTEKKLPPVEVALRDKDGNILDRWIIAMPQPTLAAEQAVIFTMSRKLEHKPEDIRFAMQFWKPAEKIEAKPENNLSPVGRGRPAEGGTGEGHK